jgi:hypothetical protein
MNFAETNECFKSETDIFSLAPIQTSVEEGSWQLVSSVISSPDSGTIEFNVAATDEYIDLNQSELVIYVSIRKQSDKSIIKSTDNVGPVNNFIHSLFDQVILSLNNTQIENSNGSYPYRAYIENLLNYGFDAKTSHLVSSLFIKDSPGSMDSIKFSKTDNTKEISYFTGDTLTIPKPETNDAPSIIQLTNKIKVVDTTIDPYAEVNHGLLDRKQIFNGKTVELSGRLHIDLFNSDRYLINRIPFKLTLQRSKPSFYLMSASTTENYYAHIDKANLFIRKVKIAPSVMDFHIKQHQTLNANYPIRRVIVKQITIPKDIVSFLIDNVNIGKMPRRVVLGFVEHEAAIGTFKKNPYNFQNFDVEKINLIVAGHSLPYRQGIELDFTNNNYVRGYNTIFKGLNSNAYETGNDITYNDFKNGYSLYVFNLTPDMCDSYHSSLPKIGNLEIDIKFRTTTTVAINAIVYLEFDNNIQITNLRQVVADYKV